MLVNFVYAHNVGHAIEALHYAGGYHAAQPDLRISVALNAATPTELARYCEVVERAYPIPVDLFDGDHRLDLTALPATWDYVVTDHRAVDDVQRRMFPGLAAYHDAAGAHLRATTGRGLAGFRKPIDYVPGTHLRLRLPPGRPIGIDGGIDGGGDDGPRIALLPGGSAPRAFYPSTRSWLLVLDALLRRFPDATFCLLGKLRSDGRTSSTVDRAELDTLLAAVPRAVDLVDAPLVEQLATVGECDVLVSPHSGFGMAALAAGAPWLTIGGNRWPEYFFNGVPFYTVLPDVAKYPCYTLMAPDDRFVDDDGDRSSSMSYDRIAADLEEIVDGAARLVERRWDYETALRDHARRMTALLGGDVWSIDNVLMDALA